MRSSGQDGDHGVDDSITPGQSEAQVVDAAKDLASTLKLPLLSTPATAPP
jgi:hypothetical protein